MKPLFNALGAAVLLVMTHSAIAQEDSATQEDIAKLPRAEALDRYADWVKLANMNGCCSSPDANIGLRQRPTGDPANPLEIEFTRTVNGLNPLSRPVWVRFSAELIKTEDDVKTDALCKIQKKADEAQGKVSTCVHPPGAFVHALDNVYFNASTGVSTIYDPNSYSGPMSSGPSKVLAQYKPGEVVDADTWKLTSRYCVHPEVKKFGL